MPEGFSSAICICCCEHLVELNCSVHGHDLTGEKPYLRSSGAYGSLNDLLRKAETRGCDPACERNTSWVFSCTVSPFYLYWPKEAGGNSHYGIRKDGLRPFPSGPR